MQGAPIFFSLPSLPGEGYAVKCARDWASQLVCSTAVRSGPRAVIKLLGAITAIV